MKKIAVILSGCGYLDGSEITEAIGVLIALSALKAEYTVFAPQISYTEINHLTKEPTGEQKSVLSDAARIARSQIADLATLEVSTFDGVVFPGGYGAAKNLCNWAQAGAKATLNPQVKRVIEEFHAASKPIAAICIAPVLVAKVLGEKHVTVTIGNDHETAQEIAKTGAEHVPCAVDDFVSDRLNKVVTTPAYMYEATPFEVFTGVSKAMHELVEMA